jgi:hypothetical protein
MLYAVLPSTTLKAMIIPAASTSLTRVTDMMNIQIPIAAAINTTQLPDNPSG